MYDVRPHIPLEIWKHSCFGILSLVFVLFFFKETTLLMCRALGFRDHLDSWRISVLSFSKLKHILNMSGKKTYHRKNEILKKAPSLVSDFKAGKTVSREMFLQSEEPIVCWALPPFSLLITKIPHGCTHLALPVDKGLYHSGPTQAFSLGFIIVCLLSA